MLTRAAAAGIVLSLCWTWVDAREQGTASAPAAQTSPKPVAPTIRIRSQSHRATLDRYCVTCHSDR